MANKTRKNGANRSVVDENRGRDDARQHPKKRGTSKDVVASLDKRVEFGEEVSTLHQTIEDLQADVALCKRSLASGGGNANHGPKLDVSKPSPFVGKREARAVDDFLWEMEQYLKGVNVVHDASKIKMATRYLKDTAATRRDSSKPKDRKVNHEKCGRDKNAQPKVDHARKPPIGKDKSVKTNYKSGGCFICDGPHRARDCPKKASLNGMSEDGGAEAVDEAERLGINATKGSGTIKAVNSSAKPIHGAIQFKKGFNKSEPCYLAVTRLETDEGSSKVEVPKVIERVLDEFEDVMPKEFPKKLPPRRKVDHTIELESGSKPPAKAPYRMSPPELV
nr:reverse transcriptase [Tanacetum cinerariifolium]